MPTSRLYERFSPVIEKALESVAMGETITWEMGVAVIPTGAAPLVWVSIPHLILGQNVQGTIVLQKGPSTPDEELSTALVTLVGQLRDHRDASAAEEMGLNTNGNGGHPTG